jgi:predicted nucleic acid-binding protein
LDLTLRLRSFAEAKLLERTFEVSRQLRVTFYDATYAVLAKESSAPLITADKDLRNKIRRYCDARLLSETRPEELAE